MTNKQFFIGMRRVHIAAGLGIMFGSACPLLSIGIMSAGLISFFRARNIKDEKPTKGKNGNKIDRVPSDVNTHVNHQRDSRRSIYRTAQREVNSMPGLRGARGDFRNEVYFNRNRKG